MFTRQVGPPSASANSPTGLKQRLKPVLHGYSAGYLDAVQAVAEAKVAGRPARGTQQFAEKYRHFAIKATPWFHRDWYDAYDDYARNHLYVQGPREHAKTSTVLTYAIRRLAENHHLTMYDAAYAAAARSRHAELATLDRALLEAGMGRRPSEIVADRP